MSRGPGGSLSMVWRPREGLTQLLRRVVEQRACPNAEIRKWRRGENPRSKNLEIMKIQNLSKLVWGDPGRFPHTSGARLEVSVPMLSEPPVLRDIWIDHTCCLASLRTLRSGPERAHAAPGGQGSPGHRIANSERVLRSSKKNMPISLADLSIQW